MFRVSDRYPTCDPFLDSHPFPICDPLPDFDLSRKEPMMRRFLTVLFLTTLVLTFGQAALGQDSDADARKDKIVANLKHKFPQLAKATLVMGELKPSAFGSLDEGTVTINGKLQSFLVASDDSVLYMVSEPIDVSMSSEDLKVAAAKREAEEAAKAAERNMELAALAEGVPVKGNPEAPVTIIEFSDFQCPYCSRAANTVEQILKKYPNDVKFVFQHFPLNFHPWAKPAAIASECAANQDDGAFWTLHDSYFKDQKKLNPGNVMAKSKEYLAGSEIDIEKWSACAENKESDEYQAASAAVDAAMAAGKKYGVTGTPGFFVNGHFLNGAVPLSAFEPLIEAAKNQADG